MNTSKSAQDVLRCHLCETPVPPLSCELCQIYLCKVCAGEHILDESKEHKVVPIKHSLYALQFPKCLQHSSKKCKLYCKQCTIPICIQCASSRKHKGHKFNDLLECVERKREALKTDIQELESSNLIEHKESASRIRTQKANLDKTLEELKTAIDKHGKKFQRKVSVVVEKFKYEIVKKHAETFAAMTETEKRIEIMISDIEKFILSVKELQTSRDLGLVFEYKSRNEEFRNALLTKHNASLPTFVANKIKKDKLYELFGSLTMASDEIKTVEQGVKTKSRKCHSRSTTQIKDLCELETDQTRKQKCQNLPLENQELKERNQQLQAHNDQLQKRNDCMQKHIQQLEEHIHKLRPSSSESKKLQKSNQQLQEHNDQLHEHNQQLLEHNDHLQERNQQLHEHNDQLKEHNQQLLEHNDHLQERNQQLHEHNDQLQEHNQQLHEHNDQLQERIQQLHEHNDQLQKRNRQLQDHNDQLHEDNGHLQEHNEQLQERNQQLHEHNDQLQEHNQQLHEHNYQLQEHNQQLQERNDLIQRHIQHLQENIY